LNPAVPFLVASVIQKMMAKRPGERFQDYDALLRELERAAAAVRAGSGDRLQRARPAPAAVRVAPPSPGGRSMAWLPIVLLLLLGGLVVAGARQRLQASREREAAAAPGGNREAAPGQGVSAAAAAESPADADPDHRQVYRQEQPGNGAG